MQTVLETLNLSTDFFTRKGIESPRLNAELLLADILKMKRMELYINFERPLKADEVDLMRSYLKRRSTFEPLQYILGNTEFYGFPFDIDSRVLIPRQDTEILVEEVLKKLESFPSPKVLDIGTGSGCIILSIAKSNQNAICTALDVSPEALKVAQHNSDKLELTNRVKFAQADILAIAPKDKYDAIVSNPPYVPIKEFANLQKEIVDFEPEIAVTDMGDGYKFYRRIAQIASTSLNPNGVIFFEVGKDMHEEVASILKDNGFTNIAFRKDYGDIIRVVSGVKE